jgi:hypothetical protein
MNLRRIHFITSIGEIIKEKMMVELLQDIFQEVDLLEEERKFKIKRDMVRPEEAVQEKVNSRKVRRRGTR